MADTPTLPRLAYTLKEAEALGAGSLATLYRENQRGRLAFVKLAGRTKVLAAELHRYLGLEPGANPGPVQCREGGQ